MRMQDRITSPADSAVYWTEYVIRHNGAVHLRSPESDLSWVELLHLDLLLLMHILLIVLYKVFKKIFSIVAGCMYSSQDLKKKYD